MTSAFEIIKENLLEKKYSFLDIDYLKSEYKKEKDKLDFVFDNYIIIGIGGSSQGSKAVAEALNKKNIFYFDHLSSKEIKRVISLFDVKKIGFIFISKSGSTSEVLTLFDYLVANGRMKENEARNKFRQVCTYIHTYIIYIHTYIHYIHTYIHMHILFSFKRLHFTFLIFFVYFLNFFF